MPEMQEAIRAKKTVRFSYIDEIKEDGKDAVEISVNECLVMDPNLFKILPGRKGKKHQVIYSKFAPVNDDLSQFTHAKTLLLSVPRELLSSDIASPEMQAKRRALEAFLKNSKIKRFLERHDSKVVAVVFGKNDEINDELQLPILKSWQSVIVPLRAVADNEARPTEEHERFIRRIESSIKTKITMPLKTEKLLSQFMAEIDKLIQNLEGQPRKFFKRSNAYIVANLRAAKTLLEAKIESPASWNATEKDLFAVSESNVEKIFDYVLHKLEFGIKGELKSLGTILASKSAAQKYMDDYVDGVDLSSKTNSPVALSRA